MHFALRIFNLRPFTHYRSSEERFMISRNFLKIYSASLSSSLTAMIRNLCVSGVGKSPVLKALE